MKYRTFIVRSCLRPPQSWSPAALTGVRVLLTDIGLWPAPGGADVFQSDPLGSLSECGFVVVQNRETERQPRDVIAEDDQHVPAAELAIDITTFDLRTARVVNREIEVESKG